MMENTNILERFRCLHLPKLWTVVYPGRQTHYENGDLVASNSTHFPQTVVELRQAVEQHLDWRESRPSCFISTLSGRWHRRNWANQRDNDGTYIIEVDRTRLNHSFVFHAEYVVSKLGIECSRPLGHEYFVLHRIPCNALKSWFPLGELEELDAEIRYDRQRPFNPRLKHWVDDLYGYYDTDEEGEMHNANDDLMKTPNPD